MQYNFVNAGNRENLFLFIYMVLFIFYFWAIRVFDYFFCRKNKN